MDAETRKIIEGIMKQFTKDDFELVFTYGTMNECAEVVRLNQGGSIKDMPVPNKSKAGDIYFKTKSDGMIPFFMVKEAGDKFELYKLTYNAYCNYGF
jgi:hypothetical protein